MNNLEKVSDEDSKPKLWQGHMSLKYLGLLFSVYAVSCLIQLKIETSS